MSVLCFIWQSYSMDTGLKSLSCYFNSALVTRAAGATVGRHVTHAVTPLLASEVPLAAAPPSTSLPPGSRVCLALWRRALGSLRRHSPHQNRRLGGARLTQAPGNPARVQCRWCARGPLVLPYFRTVISSDCLPCSIGGVALTWVIKPAPTSAKGPSDMTNSYYASFLVVLILSLSCYVII